MAFNLLVSLVVLLDRVVAQGPPGPLPIVGGEVSAVCDWPSAVALTKFDSQYCTGTLIHPRVVLTAAHCVHPEGGWGIPEAIVFGEDIAAPALAVGVSGCEMHPMYDHSAPLHSPEDAHDLAYCVLAEEVTTVRPTPPIMGCETEQLTPGAAVHIVGFGADEIVPDGDSFQVFGNGIKRTAVQSLEKIDELDQLFLLGMGGSACSGDSGGPAYLQLADGSWRVLAAAARIHPDAPQDPPYCLYGVIYTGVWDEMGWFETMSGIDLTPCHAADGTWAPGPACDQLPLDLLADGAWADGCAAQPVSGPGMSCGVEMESESDSEGSSGSTTDPTTGGETTGGATTGAGSSSGGTGDAETGPGETSSGDMPTGDLGGTSGGETTSGGSSTGAPVDDGDEGCGCRSTDGRGIAGVMLMGLVFRRRRARATCP